MSIGKYVTTGRYVCDTCKTIFTASMVPIIIRQLEEGKKDPHKLLSTEEATAWRKLIIKHTDPYWRGHQGTTTSNFLSGLKEFTLWRVKHKCHRVRTLRYNESGPANYTSEKAEDGAKVK